MQNKVIRDLQAIPPLIANGSTVLVGGFMTIGAPLPLLCFVASTGVNDLHVVSSDASYPHRGVGALLSHGAISSITASHIGLNPDAGRAVNAGQLSLTLVPQGSLVEKIRSGGAGLGGVLTPTGLGTAIEEGKERIQVDGKDYLLEKPIRGDVALIMAHKADTAGNLVIRKTCRNFNEVMATAATIVIAQVNEVVDVGAIDPDEVCVPHIFVSHVVPRSLLSDFEESHES